MPAGGSTAVVGTATAAAAVAAAWGLVAAVRRTMVRPLVRDRARLSAERDRLTVQRDALLAEREQLVQDREARLAQLQSHTAQLQSLTAERGALAAERDELEAERDELQGSVDATFVNLAMRTLRLVERQLVLIETLEGREADPDQLDNLYRLDHLATRMRRNSENMLLLAGLENSRRAGRNVPLLDVLRAAVSEIERYERVRIRFLPPVRLVGGTADDTSHLVAELLENATAFSPPQDLVEVGGWLLDNGELMISVTDHGIGIPADRLRELNEQLENPDAGRAEQLSGRAPWREQTASARSMGLFVVSRLARRHGVRVQLRETAAGGGVTAIVVVPREAVVDADLTAADVDEQREAERTAQAAVAGADPAEAQPAAPAPAAGRTAAPQPAAPQPDAPRSDDGQGGPPPLPRRTPVLPAARASAEDDQHGRTGEGAADPEAESRPRGGTAAASPAPVPPEAAAGPRTVTEPEPDAQAEPGPEPRSESESRSAPEPRSAPPSESRTGSPRPAAPGGGGAGPEGAPEAGGTDGAGAPVTRLGLPRRVPRGGGLPGTGEGPGSGLRREAGQPAASGERTGSTSAAELRRRLGGFQSGLRQAAREAAAPAEGRPAGEAGAAGEAQAGGGSRGVGGSSSEEAGR
ncbi:hypothetical protein LO771_11020 [Streptacidiphilus sp. ASG 303]|uniref:ATP-binding protein n=1 Tax=Streptacidiphilus sp. ASG 303 TaxID=2896847 RepID=UPI001E598094|nr:ATP-binding protein [Streptacidiphilus sp. ASG 303]MCD0482916.1 hypothetical protein [Streptacidiphilus sp. ASG 303]